MQLTDLQVLLLLGVYGGSLYYTWNTAMTKGYDHGYFDACADVAEGNIVVKKAEDRNDG